MKIAVFILVPVFVFLSFESCTKDNHTIASNSFHAFPHVPVDSIIGTYYGITKEYGWNGSGWHSAGGFDTTGSGSEYVIDTITVQKVGYDSFMIMPSSHFILFIYEGTHYYSGNNYDDSTFLFLPSKDSMYLHVYYYEIGGYSSFGSDEYFAGKKQH